MPVRRRTGAALVAALLTAGLLAPADAALAATVPKVVPSTTWSGWVSSPTDTTRRLTPITPSTSPVTVNVTVDPSRRRQTWLGVGGSLTDSSVTLLSDRTAATKLLFDTTATTGARLNLVRLPLTATDFSSRVWSFAYSPTTKILIVPSAAIKSLQMLSAIKTVRPGISVIATPWSAPATMKTPATLNGGALTAGRESAYADMLAAQAQWLLARGVPLKAMSLGNEPGHATSAYPTMTMTDAQMAKIATRLAPVLSGKSVGLWAVDHNWSDRGRVDAVTAAAPGAFNAAAFHCYGGTPDLMAGTSIPAVVSECTGSTDNATSTFFWDADVLVKATVDAGATGLMMWNLALDTASGPKLPGGCPDCRGLLQVDPATGTVTPQPEFYTLAHLSRAADVGAVNLATTAPVRAAIVAFSNPDGTIGVYGHNPHNNVEVFSIRVAGGAERRFEVGPYEMFTLRGPAGTPEALLGRIVHLTDGSFVSIDVTGVRHAVTSMDVFICLGGWANTVENVPATQVAGYLDGGTATCLRQPSVQSGGRTLIGAGG